MAQQPYSVTVNGIVIGCTPNTAVTIVSLPGVVPPVNVTIPVTPPNCSFSETFGVGVQGGGFMVSVPCQGAIQSQVVQYMVPALGDSTAVTVIFNCGNTMTDCLGVVGGSALPGTACTTFMGQAGTWSANCVCIADSSSTTDCLGIAGGSNLPGTPCASPNGLAGTWSPDCICLPDSSGGALDCLGIPGGSNLPGTPCWVLGTNFIGMWDANCACVDSTNTGGGCQASFWAMQAVELDSLNPNGVGSPIPYEVWVWNLSTGNGAMTYFWDFGDGSTSNVAYPSHVYAAGGPYLLCLTISDASGCTSVYCDSISMDGDGILVGMVLEDDADGSAARQDGFTINVQNPLVMGVNDASALTNAALWPNPTTGDLNLALVTLAGGAVDIAIHDVNGRMVRNERRTASLGRSQFVVNTNALPAGVYTLRAMDQNGKAISLRFVKSN